MIKSISRRNNKIKEFITRDTTINKCRISGEKYKNTFTRNRKISCKDLLLMTLNKQGKSTSFEVRDFVLIKKGESKVEYSDEAYLKQRRKLNPDVFKEMNKIYLNDFYTEEKYVEKEKGYIICAIDGSKDEIPNTIKNRKEFGYAENQEGVNCARALFSSIYDINNHFYLDVEIDKYKGSEIDLAKKNIENANEIIGNQQLIIIFDRGYPSIEFFYWMEKKNIQFLIRLREKDYKEEKKRLKSNDEILELKYSYSRMQIMKNKYPKTYEEIKDMTGKEYRFTRINIGKENSEYLISNISMKEFNTEELKVLYSKRWKIEESYNTIKNKLKIESFTGKLPIFIYQDIYAQTMVYNQLQDMLHTGNKNLSNKNKAKELKLEYKINENKAIGLYKEKYIKILLMKDEKKSNKCYDELINEMIQYITAIRKNRKTEPRKWNHKNKYRTNFKPTF